uniref:Bifunctional inhibitor/plant lipid transfer protein/seed storage helical domain-containing protein n=2 Tax=Setaria TaxID=4554 RepID=K4AMR4_SETIT|nr:hypothetical protein SEVIR_9G143100v2 [Setaria viridis]
MARSREILLLPGLLLVVLVAAAPSDAAAVRGCQLDVLAPTVALFCAHGLPAEWCCQALAHSARVGGGARCLCRLAAEEPLVRAALNSTYLLWLYTACASSGHAGGPAASYSYPPSSPPAASASACDGAGDAPAAAAPADATGCATAVLADQMELFCRGGRSSSSPNPPCCEAVVGSVRGGADGVPCFCHVPQSSRSFGVDRISGLYAACVGSGPGDAGDLAGKCPSPRSAANAQGRV